MRFVRDLVDVLLPESVALSSVRVAGPVVTRDGSETRCAGMARRTVRAKESHVTFAVRASPLRRTTFELRFVVDGSAKAAVVAGDETIRTVDAIAEGRPTLHAATIDLTTLVEKSAETLLTVDFAFAQEGAAYFFEKGEACAPLLRQRLDRRHTSMAIAFFALSFLLLLFTAFIVADRMPSIRSDYRAYGVLGIALAATYHLLGGPELPALRVRERTRVYRGREPRGRGE